MTSLLGEVEQTNIDNAVKPFVQLLKIHYLVSYKVISYNIKTVGGLKSIQNMLSPEKLIPKQRNHNNEHIYNLKRNVLNIQVDVNTELLYIRLKLTFNTCSCGIWLVTAFTAAISKSMRILVGSFPCLMTAFLTSWLQKMYHFSEVNTLGKTW